MFPILFHFFFFLNQKRIKIDTRLQKAAHNDSQRIVFTPRTQNISVSLTNI